MLEKGDVGSTMENTIQIVRHNECTGCGACYNVCPTDAISMKDDREGFLVPSIDETKCIKCGMCAKICPALHYKLKNDPEPDCYAVWADEEIRMVSSSGGMFTLLAEYVLEKGGAVCGAAYTEDYRNVKHIVVEDKKGLEKLRGSKYVQSDIGLVYREIRDILKQDRYVLFCGCPCQVAGLYSFLQKEYPKLYTCDLICHGANSPKAYKAFLKDREKQQGEIEKVNFREKEVYGWSTPTTIHFKNGSVYRRHASQCTWYKGFLGGIINREVCDHCKYATSPRVGDITLGDFWHIKLYDPALDDNKGTSCILINSEKGKEIFNIVKDKMKLCRSVPVSHARQHNWQLRQPQKADPFRKYFFEQLDSKGYDAAINRVKARKFDVGVVAWWYNDNYGGVLTSYALHESIRKLGLSVLMIDIPTITVDRKQADLPTMSRNFGRKHYYSSAFLPDMKSHNLHCDTFISGSDQMWSYALRQKSNNRTDYHLNFVYDYKKKISYASSFGSSGNAPEEYNMKITNLLHKFDFISVREDFAVKICEDTFGVKAVHVLDPVFIADPAIYDSLAEESNASCPKKYLCAYILDPTEEKKKAVRYAAEKLGLELIVIGDPEPLKKENKRKLSDLPGFQENVELEDFVRFMKNADFVITDSYHGTCFSMLFRRNFISIGNRSRGVERFLSLFRQFPLSYRMVLDIKDIFAKDELFDSVDYTEFDKVLEKERIRCREWLKNAIFSKKEYKSLDFSVVERDIDILHRRIDTLKAMHYEERDKLSARIAKLEEKMDITVKKESSPSPVKKSENGKMLQKGFQYMKKYGIKNTWHEYQRRKKNKI